MSELIARKLAHGPCWIRSFNRLRNTLNAMIEADEVVSVKPYGGAARNMVALTTIGAKRYGITSDMDFETPMCEQINRLADLVADGTTVTEAGKQLGMTPVFTRYMWKKIKDSLGWQAV